MTDEISGAGKPKPLDAAKEFETKGPSDQAEESKPFKPMFHALYNTLMKMPEGDGKTALKVYKGIERQLIMTALNQARSSETHRAQAARENKQLEQR